MKARLEFKKEEEKKRYMRELKILLVMGSTEKKKLRI